MNRKECASISIMKILCVSIIIVLISGITVMAVNTNLKNVTIELENGYDLVVMTAKTTVAEVLNENNIILDENQKTIPDANEVVNSGLVIKIVDKSYQEIQIAKVTEQGTEVKLDDLLNNYAPINEKIVTEQVAIPYETITKNTAGTNTNTTDKVIQEGQDGIKEITYKVKYQKDIEIEKIKLSEKIIKEPINKIIQVNKVTNRSNMIGSTTGNGKVTYYKVTAYCPCIICCGKTNGITSSGSRAIQGVTVAAPSKFAFGTKLNIGGHTYTVQDRGGAIKGNKIDIFMNTHAQALAFGIKYLPVTVVE